MDISLINPYIRVAMESKIPSGHHIFPRIIYDYELIYLESGEFTFVYDGVSYHSKAGDFIFIRPGIEHSFQLNSGDISQPHIHFDFTYRPRSEKIPVSFKCYEKMTEVERSQIHQDYFAAYPRTPFISIKNKDGFLDCFYRIVRKNHDNVLTNKLLIMQLIATIIDDNFQNVVDEQRKLCVEQQIKEYIDAGNGFGMSLDDFSNMFFFDKFYLEKKFKKAFGNGIVEYKNKKRLGLADGLLEKFSVTETSELLGYQSIYSFSRAYKNHFGYAPSERKK